MDGEHQVKRSTGEVVNSITVQVPIGTIFYTPEQQEEYKERKEDEEQKKIRRANNKPLGEFCFMNSKEKYKDVSPQTVTRLVYLATYLPYDESCLCKWGGKKMVKKDVERVLKLSRASFFRFWKEVNGKYLYEREDGTVCFSKDFHRGRIEGLQGRSYYQKVYSKRVRELYERTPVSRHKHLGYVFQMLPYVSTEFNIICFNPEEEKLEKILPMSVDGFCDAAGVVAEQRARFIKAYAAIKFTVGEHEERFCSFVSDGLSLDKARIFVNPRVLYNGHSWERVEILGAFADYKQHSHDIFETAIFEGYPGE